MLEKVDNSGYQDKLSTQPSIDSSPVCTKTLLRKFLEKYLPFSSQYVKMGFKASISPTYFALVNKPIDPIQCISSASAIVRALLSSIRR